MVKKKRVLVTGGAGFIGSHLVRSLVSDGFEVCVLDDLSTGHRANISDVLSDIDFREGDIRDSRVCAEAAQGAQCIYHLAALASVSRSMADPMSTHSVNVNGTLNILEAARKAKVKRVVFSSSSSIYGDAPVLPKTETSEPLPRSPYAASKLSGEQYVLAYARAGLVEGVGLRYFNVFGPRQDPNGPYAAVIPLIMRAAAEGAVMRIFGDGKQTRDFTYIDNVVRANRQAAELPAERCSGFAVNVGAGQRVSLLDVVEYVSKLAERDIEVRHEATRAGDVMHSLADLTRAREVLDYEPQVDVRDGLARTWEWTKHGGHEESLKAVAN